MAYIAPNSDIYLLSGVPFDPTYENTMYFDTSTNQAKYFLESTDLTRLHLTSYSYIRKTQNQIKVELSILNARFYNYLMFRNISFEGKWFYAFISEMEYINNTTALITFEIDLIQSWMFDYDFNQCMIEREHTVTDEIGENIINEGLDTGEYIYADYDWYGMQPVVVLATTVEWDSTDNKYVAVEGEVNGGRPDTPATTEGDYYTACKYFVAYPERTGTGSGTIADLNSVIEDMTDKNKVNAIVSIFMADRRAIVNDPQTGVPPGFSQIIVHQTQAQGKFYVGEHLVRNKKLLCYPYNFIQVSNLLGEAIDYRWEFFDNSKTTAYFNRWGNVSLNPGVILYAMNYKGLYENMEEIVTVNNFPQCSFNNDSYKAWLAQNRGALTVSNIQVAGSIISGLSQMAASPEPGAGIGQLMGGLNSAMHLMAQYYDHSTLPPTNHGSGNGDLMYQARNCGFLVSKKCVTENFADRIDEFFTMFGYKTNRVGKPNLSARPYYTYVKTSGCSVRSRTQSGGFEVPADDSRAIERIYDKGIRFWTTSAKFGSFDYDDNDNSPVTPSSNTPEVPTEPTEPTEPVTPDPETPVTPDPDPEEEEES